VFAQAEAFSARVAREIRERRAAFLHMPEGTVQLKEAPGGLREIDLCLAAEKARLRSWEAVDDDLFGGLALRDPGRGPLYRTLSDANDFLVTVRSLCRVCIAASDEIHRDHLGAPARILGYAPPSFPDPTAGLLADLARHTSASAHAVAALLPGIA
jgi:hypothetical protein